MGMSVGDCLVLNYVGKGNLKMGSIVPWIGVL